MCIRDRLGSAHDTPWSMCSKSKVDCVYITVDYVVGYGQRSGVSRVRDRREFNDACSSLCHLLGGGVCIPYEYMLPEHARHVRSVWGFTGT